jgi:tetratricopeptide (TPR) repeat protein
VIGADTHMVLRFFLVFLALYAASGAAPQAAAPLGHQTVPDEFNEARHMMAEGNFDQAAVLAKDGLTKDPHNVVGLNLLGVIYNQEGKYQDAIVEFKQALTIAPSSVDTLVNLGTSLGAQNKDDEAERYLKSALRLQPGNKTANYNLGALMLDRKRPREALSYLLRIPSPDQSAQLALIRAYLDSGMLQAGLASAKKLSHNHSKDPRVHFSLGVLLASHRQYQQAAYEFEQADALQPGNFDILHDLGQAYLLTGKLSKAQEILNQALRLQPDSADTLYLLAETAAGMQKEVDALELLVRARKIAPENTNIVFLMAQLSMKQSFFDDAIELLNEGLKIDPKRSDFYAARGESYFTVGKTDKALEDFKRLVLLDPSPRSYVFMGLCYRHLGKYDEAKRYLKQSLSGDSRNVPALFNLGFIARKEGDHAQAEQYLQRAVGLDHDYPEAVFELASLRMDQKKYAEAIPLLQHFTQASPSSAQGYYKLAISERNLHQAEAAERDMNSFKTLSKSPQPAPFPLQHFFDYLERRGTLTEQQQNETDVRQLEAEVQQHPDRPRSLYALAESLLKLGRTNDAMQILRRLDTVSAGDFRTELNEGVLLGRFHLFADSIRYFQASLKLNPSSDEAQYNLAEAQFENGNYDEALNSLLHVSAGGQKESSYLGLLGDVFVRLGRYQEASRSLQQAIEIAPDNDQYYASLALVQLRARDLAEADRTVQRGLARIPDSGVMYWTAGIVRVVQGREREAENLLKKASQLDPSRESMAATLGIFYYEEGRLSDAREVLRRCMEMFPQGTLDFQEINGVLDAAASSNSPKGSQGISVQKRKEFYELALAMREQEK